MASGWWHTHWGRRFVSVVLGIPTWTVLGLAAFLDADARGFGTHQQLGLGTCTVLGMTGWPCPMCGMTTSFTHMAHIRPLEALSVQPFGSALFLVTLVIGTIAVVELFFPRGRWSRVLGGMARVEVPLAVSALMGLFFGWLYKTWQMGLW